MNTDKQLENKVQQKFKRNKKIGLFSFFTMTASMVITIYEYASFASVGWALILFLLIGGFCWFIPVAIMAAEMATIKGWEEGGIYSWVSKTLGKRYGFLAIFFQWFQITIGFVTMLLFVIATISFGFGGVEGLHQISGILINTTEGAAGFGGAKSETSLKVAGILFALFVLIFLVVTCSQLFGVCYTTIISRFGFVIGIIIPFIILFILGVIFISQKGLNGGMDQFLPNDSGEKGSMATISQLVVFVSFILSYLGVEASASHIKQLKKPEKNYPRVLAILVVLSITFSSIAGVIIAIATKVGSASAVELNFSAGILQAFIIISSQLLSVTDAIIFTRVVAVLMAFAVVAQISGWVVGPSKAIHYVAQQKLLPKSLTKVNRFGAPVNIIAIQTGLVILWGVVIIIGMIGGLGSTSTSGGSNIGFMGAMQLTTLTYLISYFLLIIAYFKLNISKKIKYETQLVILKSKKLKYAVAGLCLLTNAFAFTVAFFPQSDNNLGIYYGLILGLFIPSLIIPNLIYTYFNHRNFKVVKKTIQENT